MGYLLRVMFQIDLFTRTGILDLLTGGLFFKANLCNVSLTLPQTLGRVDAVVTGRRPLPHVCNDRQGRYGATAGR